MRFSQEFRNGFPYTLSEKFDKYIQTVHPFPFDHTSFYWFAFSDEEHEWMDQLLERYPKKLFCKGDDMYIEFPSLEGKRDFLPESIQMNLTLSPRYNGWPFPDRTIKDTDIRDAELRKQLLAWTVTYFRLRHMRDKAVEYLEDILNEDEGLNTPGQLFRVWEEIGSVMPPRYSNRVMGQKLKSSLPAAFLERWTVEEFREQEHFDEINNHFLAMSVMDLKKDENFPNYW